jgi:hypothetical protein
MRAPAKRFAGVKAELLPPVETDGLGFGPSPPRSIQAP